MNEARVGMLVIGRLTKSDKMIYVHLSEISHLFKIGIANNDLIGHNFFCFLWELQHQISKAAREHLPVGISIMTSVGLHQNTQVKCVIQGCLCVGIVRVEWKWLWWHGTGSS